MKSLKIYLIVVSVLLFLALCAGVYVWYTIQNFQKATGTVLQEERLATPDTVKNETPTEAPTTNTTETTATSTPVVIEVNSLTDTQQKILRTLGIQSDSITITPQMIVCAKAKLGVERFNTILNGAAPTPFESVALAGCLK